MAEDYTISEIYSFANSYQEFGVLPNNEFMLFDGNIELYDNLEQKPRAKFDLGGESIVVANIDGNPGLEFIGVSSNELFVFSEFENKVIWTRKFKGKLGTPAFYFNTEAARWQLAISDDLDGLVLLETKIQSEEDIAFKQDRNIRGSILR